jgi:S1-C subfamily serine protease
MSDNARCIVFIHATVPTDPTAVPNISDGTGFIVSSDGYVLTCNHVVQDDGKVIVKGSIGGRYLPPYDLEVIERAPSRDLCILRLPYNPSHWPSIQTIGDATPLEPVISLGFPTTSDLTPQPGMITANNAPHGHLTTNTPLFPGMSGGPVFNRTRAVVAVVASGHKFQPGLDELIPIRFATQLLQTYASPVLTLRNQALQDSGEKVAEAEVKLQKAKEVIAEGKVDENTKEKIERKIATAETAKATWNQHYVWYYNLNRAKPGLQAGSSKQRALDDARRAANQFSVAGDKVASLSGLGE